MEQFTAFFVPRYHVQEVEGTEKDGSPQDNILEKSVENKISLT